jgi:hypothetical protein
VVSEMSKNYNLDDDQSDDIIQFEKFTNKGKDKKDKKKKSLRDHRGEFDDKRNYPQRDTKKR